MDSNGTLSPVCVTHSLHQDELCAADETSVDPLRFFSEHSDALLQPPLLHRRWHVVLEPVEGVRFLNVGQFDQNEKLFMGWVKTKYLMGKNKNSPSSYCKQKGSPHCSPPL